MTLLEKTGCLMTVDGSHGKKKIKPEGIGIIGIKHHLIFSQLLKRNERPAMLLKVIMFWRLKTQN